MMSKLRKMLGFNSTKLQTLLPAGLKAAAPIEDKKLLASLMDDDLTTSGGTHSVANGKPLLGRQTVHR
jgi:hypothetical protein